MGLFLTDAKCRWQREYVNIPSWHEKGYLGEGLTIFHDDLGNTSHNECCVDIIQTILPIAKIYSGRINFATKNGNVYESTISCNETAEKLQFDEFITKYDISLINNSTTGGKNDSNSPIAVYMREKVKQYNLIGTGAFGNYASEPNNRFQGAFIMVSGVSLMKDFTFQDYGVSGAACDFSMFMGFQSGTSFSAPFLCGMIGLLRCKYGRGITQEEAKEYLKEHCEDLGTEGWNPQFGYGLPKLGEAEMEIILQIDNPIMTVDGKEVELDQEPFIMPTGRTVVPLRAISEAMGAVVKWESDTKTITITK